MITVRPLEDSDFICCRVGNRIVFNKTSSYMIRFINTSWQKDGTDHAHGHQYLTVQNEHAPHDWLLVETQGTADFELMKPC